MTGTFHIQSVTSLEGLVALRSEWLALERSSHTRLPFQTWEWSYVWWMHLHEDGLGVRDLLHICVVRNGSGEVVGIAPLILTERPTFGPLRVRYLQFIGADPNITEIRTVVCHPAFEQECYAAVRAYLAGQSRGWDWIAWEGLPRPHDPVLGQTAGLSRADAKSAFLLDLAPTWDAMRTGFKRNIKESLRKCYNSLRRDGLTWRLEILEQPDDIAAALDDFFRLHATRASQAWNPSHADVFTSPQAHAFLTDVCRRLALRGITRLFRLWVDDRVVAVRIGFQMAEMLYLYYSGWDTSYAQYSVMTTLVAEVLQDAIRNGLQTVHLSTGNDVSKTRWGPREQRYFSTVELSPRASARAMHDVYEGARRVATAAAARSITLDLFVRRSSGRPGIAS